MARKSPADAQRVQRRSTRSRPPSTRANPSLPGAERWLLQKELWGLILLAMGIITVISLSTRDQGMLTDAWALLLRQIFGLGAFPFALLLTGGGLALLLYDSLPQEQRQRLTPRWQAVVGWELIYFAGLALIHVSARIGGSHEAARPGAISFVLWDLARLGQRGGFLGWSLSQAIMYFLGRALAILILTAFVLGGVYLVIGPRWPYILTGVRASWSRFRLYVHTTLAARRQASRSRPVPLPPFGRERPPRDQSKLARQPRSAQQSQRTSTEQSKATSSRSSRLTRPRRVRTGRDLPGLDLLVPDAADTGSDAEAREKAQVIEETLGAFGIPVSVVEWHRGPVVTQFGIEPGYVERQDREGNVRRFKVRVSKILSLTNDLALALAASPIRIEAPVPGRPIVGIEVPNDAKALVGLRGVLEAPNFRKRRRALGIALGRDVSGQAVVADLVAMPHLLIAGATGSGKSVCLNACIASLLFQHTPDQLQLVMVDPKRVELTKYNGIPHLVAPVIVEIAQVIGALRWAIREMEQRYKQFSAIGARNLNGYNSRAKAKGDDALPMIVIVVDELADLMLAAPDDVEATICRLAQMARATGIHLVIATQRPSVDVVTGLIKANFPARISFAVTSQIDSRVILDTPGAEKLLGKGDMLFMAPDSPKLQRIQGCFISDEEIDRMAAHWRRKALEARIEAVERPPWEGMSAIDKEDEILQRAIDLVREREQASASFLQRHLRIGYPRAARLIDELEDRGVVGPAESGGRSRSVLESEDDGDGHMEAEVADSIQDET